MFNKKRALKVTMIEDEPQDGQDMYRPSPRPLIELNPYMIKDVAKSVTAAYAGILTVRTLCGIATHVVVTKVK